MERTVFEVTLAGGRALHTAAYYAPNPGPNGKGHDAAIGYVVADPETSAEIARGTMDYASDQKIYDEITDARDDLMDHLKNVFGEPVIFVEDTDVDPELYI